MAKKYSPQDELFLEESIDSLSSEKLDALELPLSRKTFLFILIVALAVGGIAFFRIIFLGGWQGSFYGARAEINVGKEIHLPAARGIIYDRFGEPLVENVASFSVSVKINELLKTAGLLGLSAWDIKDLLKDVDLEKTSSLVVARNVDPEKIVQLRSLNSLGVEIINDYKRSYSGGSVFSHILGYTGPGPVNKIEGKVGLEAFYDQFLRGKPGKYLVYRDAFGNVIDKKSISQSENGYRLDTTIDSDLQRYFYYRLSDALAYLGIRSAVGIALNPQNGEVLSLISLPSFNNNIFSEAGHNREKTRLLNSSAKPLFNRAVSGNYNPGSTIKPLMALAALREGVVDTKKQIYSAGFIEIPNPYYPDQPSVFLDWKPHGWVDLHSALARSSNVYFYAVGGGLPVEAGLGEIKGLGIATIKEYWQKLGLGKKTGIDLNSEGEGFLPDPEEKELRTNDIWRLGDTYNISIGQGDLLVTPIQLISQIAAVANGGKFYKPRFVKSITDADGNIIQENQPEILIDNSDLKEHLKEVQKGMEDAVGKWYGTAYSLNELPFRVAGKTGSAQVANNTKTNAFFVGYAPADNPQIAILVLVENAREGSLNAVPVAKDVLEWYYWNRLIK